MHQFNLFDAAERKAYIDGAETLRERISRGFEVPDYFHALGHIMIDSEMRKHGYVKMGGCSSQSDYMNAWTQLEKGCVFGEQSRFFESTSGRRVRYNITVQPDLSVKWTVHRYGHYTFTRTPFAEGTDIESMLEHAAAHPRPFGGQWKSLGRLL